MATRKTARKAATQPTLQAEGARRYMGSPYIQHSAYARDGKVVEHWDVIQPLPETSNNPNGHF